MIRSVLGSAALTLAMLAAGCGGGGGDAAPVAAPAAPPQPVPEVSLDAHELTVSAASDVTTPTRVVHLSVGNMPQAGLYHDEDFTQNGLQSVTLVNPTATGADLQFVFKPVADLANGVYDDTVDIVICLDPQCDRHASGSPMRVVTHYTVSHGVGAEPGVPALETSSRTTLPHDVVDARYSAALNAVVMVSSWPQNALYVYDAASGSEASVPLARAPLALSIGPDGMHAAVGHDALVSHVDLTTVGVAGAPAPVRLDVSALVGDLVLDGRGHVFVFPKTDQWVDVYAIDIATNTQTHRWGPTYAGTRVALHPSGSTIYGADNGLSPDDIANYDISSGEAVRLRDSPYHGDYPMCGNLWLSADGARIYTACGRIFRASTVASDDMHYVGALALSTGAFYGYRIASLSARVASNEVVLVENERYGCERLVEAEPCRSHLSFYDADTLGLVHRFALPPVTVEGVARAQRGLFVFHRADGGKVLLSRLDGVSDSAQRTLLSIVP